MCRGKRRTRAALGWVVVLLWAVAGCQSGGSKAQRPNVVIYLVDALRRDHLGVYGYDRYTSPYIDAFARDAVVYDDAYSTTVWTKPAVASILTGLTPVKHGVQDRRHYLPDNVPVLAQFLKEIGYTTTAVVTNPHASAQWGFGRGFDNFDETKNWTGTRSDEVNDAVFPYLDRGKKPFFFYIHTIEPHGPEAPPSPYAELFGGHPLGSKLPKLFEGSSPVVVENAKAVYDGAIRFNDLQFGRLVAKLKDMNEYDNTLIILVADHGEEHLDHGQGGHGQQLFNEVAQIPMIVKYPKSRSAGTLGTVRSSLLDIAPTVMAVAGSEVPASFEGIDLSHLSKEDAEAESQRKLLLDLNQVRLDGVLFVARAVVEGRYKYVEDLLPEQKRMLFDLDADPGETTNIIATDSTKVHAYARLLRDYQAEAVKDAVPLDLREGLKALGYLN